MTEAIPDVGVVVPGSPRARRRRGLYADCLRTYLQVVAGLESDSILDRIILRTNSRRALELLALWATDGRLRVDDILAHAGASGSSIESLEGLVGKRIDPSLLVRLARVLALQAEDPGDRRNATALMAWIYRQVGRGAFRSDHARLFQNLVFDAGDFGQAAKLVNELGLSRLDTLLMKADLANPNGPSSVASRTGWDEIFARLFSRDGLEEPTVASGPESEPFDGLTCLPEQWVDGGPLVTVIVTSWQPGPGLETAVRSLLGQSWRNTEILLVDDASPPEYRPLLERVAALDERVRLIVMPRNGGTYNARNEGLKHARGEFVTGQDSDDWSHPRRIEKQVEALMKRRRLVSTTSHALRCDAFMIFNAPGTQARRENASSLMFRRREVLERVGFYDATRKGGDTEFMLRMRRVFGERSHKVLELNLALIRQSRDSLSTAEFRPGWRHPARAAYRRSYEYWHATAPESALKLEGVPSARRVFPIPSRFGTDKPSDVQASLDVVFADDLRAVHDPVQLRALLDEVNVARRSGLTVGLMHLRSFRDISFERIDTFWTAFSKLLHDGMVHEVLSTDRVTPSILVVRRPEVALFLSPRNVAVRPDRLVVVAEEPITGTAGRTWFAPEACDRNLRDAFAKKPVWMASYSIARELRKVLPAKADIGDPYPVVVDMRSWRSPLRRFDGRRPVIGRIAEGSPTDFPADRSQLLAAYPPTGKLPTRFLGGEAGLLRALAGRPVPGSWTIHPAGSVDPELFLSGCDFFVFFDQQKRKRVPLRIVAQALASGCVVILPKPYAGEFSEAVIAASPEDVSGIVQRLIADSQEFASQVARGLEFVKRNAGKFPWARTAGPLARVIEVEHKKARVPKYDEVGSPVMADHLRIALRTGNSARLDATVLRTGSEAARELFAVMASGGLLSEIELLREVEACRAPERRASVLAKLDVLDPEAAIRFARILVLQALRPDDRLNGLTLCEIMIALKGAAVLPRKWAKLFIDTAILLDKFATAQYLLKCTKPSSNEREFAVTDLAHPAWGGSGSNWLRRINHIFDQWGLLKLSFKEGDAAAWFDRMYFDVPAACIVDDGPLVTIVITAWRPAVAMKTALRSVLSQTWRNIEVLIVDDASPPEFRRLFDECERMDERVRVLRHEANAGTYVGRNTAIAAARGDFVTFQDSDDCSHPQRIELQLKPLLADQEIMATRSASARVDERLVFANPGSAVIQGNASSLMFRREEVVRRIGYFDTVRKAADTEYALRIEAEFNQPVYELDPKMPLALVRLEPGSLSRSEFKPGWRHPARTAYREAYELWHEEIRLGKSSPYKSAEIYDRHFPAPFRFDVEQDRGRREYGAVFIGDWRHFGGPQKSMLEEIRALTQRGCKVAICHMEAFRFMTRERLPLCSAIRRLINDEVVDQIHPDDSVGVSLAILRYPPILQFPPAGRVGWKLRDAIIVANQAPSELDGSDVRYSVVDVIRNASKLFGMDPTWVPQGPQVRVALEPLVPSTLLGAFDMPGVLVPAEWYVDRPSTSGRLPVIGRYSRDNVLKFPAALDELLAAYPASDRVEVRIMGGERACRSILGARSIPSNWELLAYGAVDVKSFLAEIDYFVYFDNGLIVEAFGRSILEAIASGCIVVLPEKFRPVFGEAAVYCAPDEVASVVERFEHDAHLKDKVIKEARSVVSKRFSHAAYSERIESLIGSRSPQPRKSI